MQKQLPIFLCRMRLLYSERQHSRY